MERTELIYAKRLFYTRVETCKNWLTLSPIIYIMFLLFLCVMQVLQMLGNGSKTSVWYEAPNFFKFVLNISLFICVFSLFFVERTDHIYEVYPHTNSTLFLSRFVLEHFIMFLLTVFAFILQLLIAVCIAALAGKSRVIPLVPFSFLTLLSQFIITLVYVFLIISALAALTGSQSGIAVVDLFRRFVLVIISLSIINVYTGDEIRLPAFFGYAFRFIVSERRIPLFVLKAFIVWLLLSAAAYYINRREKPKPRKNNSIVNMSDLLDRIILLSMFLLLFIMPTLNNAPSAADRTVINDIVMNREYYTYSLGLSGMRGNTGLTVRFENSSYNIREINSKNPQRKEIDEVTLEYDTNELAKYAGSEITVIFSPPVIIRNGIDIAPLLNPRIETECIGRTLTIRYLYDDKTIAATNFLTTANTGARAEVPGILKLSLERLSN